MRILLVHQNFPGQFRQLVPYLLQLGHELVAICSHQRDLPQHRNLRILRYQEPSSTSTNASYGHQLWDDSLSRAELIGKLFYDLYTQKWLPDTVLVHSGWGEALPIKTIFPLAKLIVWPELWLLPEHLGYGTDIQLGPPTLDLQLANLGRNALTEASLARADAWILPTQHQASSFPHAYQGAKMHVIHEGIDCRLASPDPSVSFKIRGLKIDKDVPTITFVNRNLERLRGFDMFMRAIPTIQKEHKTVRIIIVGDNEPGYGGGHPSGSPLKDVMLQELNGQINLERIHFLGRIPHPYLIKVLQASWVHVYLSYPFILGWSLLEAMACGCTIVGSKGMPVEEVILNGVNGLLVPMGNHDLLSQRVLFLLANPSLRSTLANAARSASLAWDQKNTLPKIVSML